MYFILFDLFNDNNKLIKSSESKDSFTRVFTLPLLKAFTAAIMLLSIRT